MSAHSLLPAARKTNLINQVLLAILNTYYSIRKDYRDKPDSVGMIITNRRELYYKIFLILDIFIFLILEKYVYI